jgi:hypothetical protein
VIFLPLSQRAAGQQPPAPPAPTAPAPWDLREVLLARRAAAVATGDLAQAALIHADLGREAIQRARAVHDAWMRLRSRATGLFPQSTTRNEWNYNNTAADLFCFLWITAIRTAAPSLPDLQATLEAEARLAPPGELCGPVRWDDAKPIPSDENDRMFGTSEYAKDGLLSLIEATGDDRALARLHELARTIIARSHHKAPRGPIPSIESEVNGNMLQVFSRLGCEPDGRTFADAAARIADAVIDAMLPANHGLPAHAFDYETTRPLLTTTRLRDHGSEIIPGLAEAHALAVTLSQDPIWRERANRWRPPLLAMFDRILTTAVDRNGLLVSAIDPANGRHIDPAPNDNWGYVLSGALLMTEALRRDGDAEPERAAALLARIDAIASAVARTSGLQWEPGTHDGYADTIESALYIAAHRPSTARELIPWAHSQIGIMFAMQQRDGFIGRTYLDGNFIRTAFLYADMCSGGWSVSPPDPRVSVGFARDEAGKACIVISAIRAYQGALVGPKPWSAHIPRLPWDWPRLNSWPRWCAIEGIASVDSTAGLASTPTIQSLRNGLPLKLDPGSHITITLRMNSGPR